MASNALAATNPLGGGAYNGSSADSPDPASQGQGAITVAPPQATSDLPAWLSDPTGRGLDSDWAPAAHVNPGVIALTPRDIPADVPAPAQAQASQAPQTAAPADPWAIATGGSGFWGLASTPPEFLAALNAIGGYHPPAPPPTPPPTDSSAPWIDPNPPNTGNGDSGGMFKGGIVTKNRLLGPNPAGPDDGYAPLNKGEGVLTAKAVKHYGPAIVAKLNKLLVPKEAFSAKR